MPTSSPHRTSNVAAAAALQFSVDFDPLHGDSQPSVLLLTQNMGGIEAAYGGFNGLAEGPPGLSPASDQPGAFSAFPSLVASMGSPSCAAVPEDIEAELSVSAAVRQQVAEFVADLRAWLHRISYISDAARGAEKAGSAPASGGWTNSAGAATASTTTATATSSSRNPIAGQTAEHFLRGYSPTARPPMVDVVVIHFQEIGGKYKNRQFNKYFKEQLASMLLPEAGWTSGLLTDERESDRAVVSSSACQPTRVRTAATTAGVHHISPTALTGHTGAPAAWGCPDASGTETDASEEETDAFFTAIGTIIFLSPRVMGITSCLSVPHRTYIPIVDDPMTYAGEAGRLFLSGKFAEAGRSRKGFLMVSLRVGTVQFNVCNVHLFNDDDNRVALEQSPSKYAGRRLRAVQEAMGECSAIIDFAEPLFIFGDYNVRMDGKAFVGWAEEKEKISIRPGKKQLRCPEHLWSLFADPARAAELRRVYDTEPQRLMDEVALMTKMELGEMPVTFAPTYSRVPYRQRGDVAAAAATQNEEEEQHAQGAKERDGAQAAPLATSVMAPLSHVMASATRDNFCHDRLPAWCDRVLFNVAGLEWIAGDRARPSPPPPPSSPLAASAVRERRRAEASQPRWYAYEAIDFAHMDHDGVYLLF
ncbi:putative inositol-145-trisphosphate 5-phosphatase [Leptomonas pyrrhocoris]|uniref:Putative inositol-145-trisphosphate 5-phosphatase n=1 Tax=Leptomonas pyrrhocoris TaxID=157538 RepID=A0A0M9FVZ0_LEPPY|nr:putative inositol-145-trisphosphate 5-phosphatase [Leptomonas pyrrhocoris]XP_015655506.1 putative inositol-145-trisphosphate 5-phosphatase [Leptomonas pyrrhocoris]KPA77066.1 putative inositol-145-trisphosphate 5-phosphatase [Leptomonas pyrrhocoris]KPA77067.1 putative inositol-145-trisphosphate 5-phosphatase [Leptomonas pyrrhocoris]|eukprot:XP_015655505.1 putative inositol-145-trisphosphate 5-phosphatase [Leptomonas pyrrhocoris]